MGAERRRSRGLFAFSWAALAWACAPTVTPFNEPIAPPPAAAPASEGIAVPEDHDFTPYARHALTEKIVEYAKGFCQRRSGGSIAGDYAPDALIRTAGGPEKRGLGAIAATWDVQSELLSAAKCPGPQVFIRGGTAVILTATAGTNTGTFFGFKPTGKVVGVMTATVDIFTPDGKIIEQREYADAPTLFAQLGLYPHERRSATLPEWVLECHIATGAQEERTNAALAKQMQRAFDRRDEAAYAAALAENVVWNDYTAVAPVRGKADVVKRFDAQAGAFSRAFQDCDARGVVDYVVSECTLSGVQTGPVVVAGMQVAPTNSDVIVHTLEILQVRGGKVVRGWTYGNSLELARELGAWAPLSPQTQRGDAGEGPDAAGERD